MDPDAVIARHPTVALIDELAHTNAPGSPREKRWEDVERPRRRDPRRHDAQRPAPRVRRGRGRDDHRRPGPRAAPGRRPGGGRRDRARGHEPACAPPADAPWQRLPSGANPGRPRPLLHGAKPYGAARPGPALHGSSGRGPAGGLRDRWAPRGDAADIGPRGGGRRRLARGGRRRTARRRVGGSPSRRPRAVVPEPSPTATGDEVRNMKEVADDVADLGADVVRVEGDDLAAAIARLAEARGATHVVIAHRPQGRLERAPPTPRRGASRPSSRAWRCTWWARATEQTRTGTAADQTSAGTRPDLTRARVPHRRQCLRRSACRAQDGRPKTLRRSGPGGTGARACHAHGVAPPQPCGRRGPPSGSPLNSVAGTSALPFPAPETCDEVLHGARIAELRLNEDPVPRELVARRRKRGLAGGQQPGPCLPAAPPGWSPSRRS